MIATRSSGVNSGFFSALTSTATRMRSNRCALRRMMSTWPFVSGSNDPGNIARRPLGGPAWRHRSLRVRVRQERQRAVAGLHVAHARQRRRHVRLAPRGALEHEQPAGAPAVRPPRRARRATLGSVVRRIQQDQVERACRGQAPQHGDDVAALDSIALLHAAGREVRRDQRGRAAILLDERDVRGAAAQRLDADRAGPGKAVEHARALDPRRQDVEQRLAQLVGGRPQPVPGRRLQPAPLERAGDDSHVSTTKCTSPRRFRLVVIVVGRRGYPTSISPNCSLPALLDELRAARRQAAVARPAAAPRDARPP